MRLLLRASCAISILFYASISKADITLVKAGTSAEADASEESNRHRYDNEAKNLDQDSRYIESRILNPNANGQSSEGDLQVTMVKLNH